MENLNTNAYQRSTSPLKGFQQWGFIVLRIVVGWHFLYEGIVKLTQEGWSAESYLMNSRGFLSGLFHQIAAQPTLLEIVNFLNVWGLILKFRMLKPGRQKNHRHRHLPHPLCSRRPAESLAFLWLQPCG